MEDFLILRMPGFSPRYKKWKKYGYTNAKERANLKEILEESTGGYCMYCFSRIRVDGKLYANLEHSIEKGNSNKLIECVPDIGLSCAVCNQTFKRIGERRRRIPRSIVEQYERSSACSVENRKQCTVPCKALRDLQKKYSRMADAQVILQPMGVKGDDTNNELALQYNVMNMEFEPAKEKYTYSDEEQRFIEAHIKRFRLNDPEYRSRQLFVFIQNIIDSDGKIPQYEYNNLIVELFCRKLMGKSKAEILKICKSIFIVMFSKI